MCHVHKRAHTTHRVYTSCGVVLIVTRYWEAVPQRLGRPREICRALSQKGRSRAPAWENQASDGAGKSQVHLLGVLLALQSLLAVGLRALLAAVRGQALSRAPTPVELLGYDRGCSKGHCDAVVTPRGLFAFPPQLLQKLWVSTPGFPQSPVQDKQQRQKKECCGTKWLLWGTMGTPELCGHRGLPGAPALYRLWEDAGHSQRQSWVAITLWLLSPPCGTSVLQGQA